MESSAPTYPVRYAIRGELAIAGSLHDGAVLIEDGVIVELTRANRDGDLPGNVLDAAIVAPGFVDLQVNGGFGHDVGTDPRVLDQIEARLPETGVTSYLPTIISASRALYEDLFGGWEADTRAVGARRLGLHLEGPFLSPARKGAHPISSIEAADDRVFDLFLDGPGVVLVTMAPEQPGNLQRISRLRDAGIVTSLGHTDATAAQLHAGADAGATMATHLFNAMSPFNHREPGAIGAVLTDDRLVAGLIADGVHAHPESIDLAIRAKGAERIALVTDMMSAAGMPSGEYTLGGQPVHRDGRSVRLADGTLAGSVLLMDEAIRNAVKWTSATRAQAIRMATEIPASVLGRTDIGELRVDAHADVVLLDQHLAVQRTIVAGQTVYVRT